MRKVLLTKEIHPLARKLLEDNFEVVVSPDPSQETLIKIIKDIEAMILRTSSRLTSELISNAPGLRIVARTGVGVDNVNIPAATKKGVLICITPGVNHISVAEHTVAMIMYLAKQLGTFDKSVRTGNWKIRYDNNSIDLAGKKLGLIGCGQIGSRIARKCYYGLDMKVEIYDPFLDTDSIDFSYTYCNDLKEIFQDSDFISINCPNNSETRGMVNEKFLSLMKPTAYLINTARGGIVDEEALTHFLTKKKIAGAGFDVFSQEPPSINNELLKLDNVILSPHVAGMTEDAIIGMHRGAAKSIVDYFEGCKPEAIFNEEGLKEQGFKLKANI